MIIKRCYVMRKNKTMCGNKLLKTAKLGTENHKTQDVKPKTLDPEHETFWIGRPIFPFFITNHR
jgi:hypothetical protein